MTSDASDGVATDGGTAADEQSPLAAVWEEDLVKIGVLLAGIYLAYLLVGVLLDYGVRGQLNSVATLTFYVALFALLSLALNLHWGYTGLFNIGIVGFMAVGIYVMAVVSKAPATEAAAGSVGGLGLPLWVGVIAGTVAAGLLGLVVALPALRLRADYLAIVTVATSEMVRFTFLSGTFERFEVGDLVIGFGGGSGLLLDFGSPVEALFDALFLSAVHDAFVGLVGAVIENNPRPVANSLLYGGLLLVAVAVYYLVLTRLGNSPFGRVLKAIREDEDAANALGKDTNAFKTKAFVVGCALMGLGGILWYMTSGAITPNTYRPRLTFFIWIALIIGGAGSNTGSVMGGALFAAVLFQGPRFLQSVVANFVEVEAPSSFGQALAPISASGDLVPLGFYVLDSVRQLQLIVMGLVLIFLMHRRPEGLLGHRKEPAAGVRLDRRGGDSAYTDGGETDE
ncbi:branched-chain amino acid ABC transporter permease [Halobaculum sp. MBLA0147]|uniref:branched-chain amino acid ABC transporter permease n=1 Tax=Halobaculum sp. MBLA0147 TaxID=3079934 RepID=UPI003525C76C